MIELRKNKREVVRVERATFNGIDCINARVWFADDEGEMRPSKKGLTLRVELASDLAKAIQEVLADGS